MKTQFFATTSAILMTMTMASAATIVYQEDFDGFVNGSMTGQNGWAANIADGVDITGTTDKYVIGDGSDGGSGNNNLFTLEASTQSISIEMNVRMRAHSSHDMLVTLQGAAGSLFQFGNNNAGWRMRSSDGSNLTLTQPTSDEALSASGHRFYDVRVDYDFVAETGSLNAKYLVGDANWSVIHSFNSTDLELTAAGKLPENWSGLTLRMDSTASQIDDIVITAVPEPSSAAVLGLAGFGLLLRGRRR